MRDLLSKISQLEASAPKGRRILNESAPATAEKTVVKRSLKDVFNELSESIAPGQKPLPVLDPQNKKAGMGFVTSNNPAIQNMLKNLDPKDVQIVQAPGQQPTQPQQQQQQQSNQPTQPQQQQQQQSNQPIQASNKPMQEDELDERDEGKPGKNFAKIAKSAAKRYGSREAGERVAGAVRAKLAKQGKLEEADLAEGAKVDRMVKHIEKSERKLGKSKEKASDIAWATANKRGMLDNKNKKKVKEGDIAPTSGIDTKGAGLGAGRSATTLEGKKPDFLDLDKDGNKKESMKKAASDKKKKAVKENMNNRIQAARLEGKAHGLKGHPHCGKNYDDMEECRAYHDGYKEGLDECHGMGPIVGLVKAPRMPASTRSMAKSALDAPLEEMFDDDMEEGAMDEGKLGKAAAAIGTAAALATGGGIAKNVYDYYKPDSSGYSHADIDRMSGIDSRRSAYDTEQERHGNYTPRPIDEDDMEEGNAFTAALAKTPKGGHFKVGGKTFTDRSNYDAKVAESDFAFEAWDRELNKLLNEGLSVSISKGNQGAPDSVNVNATDAEADKLLALVKQAGLGVFGGDEHSDYGSPEAGRSEVNAPGGIEVVGDHDYMMGIMKKLSGIQGSASDYEDEEGCGCNDEEEMSEATCNECGMMESQCGCHEENMMAPQKPNTQGDHNIVVSEEDLDEFLDVTVAQKGQGGDATGSSGGAGVSGVGATGGSSGVSGVGATGGTATASNSNDNTQSAQSSAAAGGSKSGTGGSTVNEVESEDQMAAQVAEVNAPDNGSANSTNATKGNNAANMALAVADKKGPVAKDDDEEDEEEDDPRFPRSHSDDPRSGRGDDIDIGESFTFESLYKKLAMIEAKESTAEKDDKAEKAGKKVTKDIEYDDKKDKKEKVDEWANKAGPGNSVSDTTFEQDIDFMTKVISGGLNKPKSTGQTTVPVVASQLKRTHSHDTTDINESVSDWAKLAGIKK
jgi:hypothetical protein